MMPLRLDLTAAVIWPFTGNATSKGPATGKGNPKTRCWEWRL